MTDPANDLSDTSVSRVYFPLRSNVGWFKSPDLREEITNRVKESLLVHDELLVEDGTFVADVLDDGGRHSGWLPPGMLPQEFRTVEFQDLKPDDVYVAMGPDGQMPTDVVLHGRSSVRFKIDYYNIFKGLDLSAYDFIKRIIVHDLDFPPEAKQVIQHNVFQDKMKFQDIETNSWVRDLVIDSLNRDLVASVLLKSGIVLDPRHGELLRRKYKAATGTNEMARNEDAVVVRHLLDVAAPNFSEMSIEEVIELRHDRLWYSFRGFVREVVSDVKTNPDVLTDTRAFDEAVRKRFDRALFEALKKKHSGALNLIVDLGLGAIGLIPPLSAAATAVSAVKSTYQYWRAGQGWYAFLMKLDRRR